MHLLRFFFATALLAAFALPALLGQDAEPVVIDQSKKITVYALCSKADSTVIETFAGNFALQRAGDKEVNITCKSYIRQANGKLTMLSEKARIGGVDTSQVCILAVSDTIPSNWENAVWKVEKGKFKKVRDR